MLDWLGDDGLKLLLNHLRNAQHTSNLWLAPCRNVAEHVLSHPEAFEGATTLDPTSWTG